MQLEKWIKNQPIGKIGLPIILLLLGTTISSIWLYRDYSILNFAISELGWSNSPTQSIFNGGLIVAGLLLPIFFWKLPEILPEGIGRNMLKLAAILGDIISISIIIIGLFPGDITPAIHVYGAIGFFAGSILMALFFFLGISLSQKTQKTQNLWMLLLPPLLILGSAIIFLILLADLGEIPGTGDARVRPEFWPIMFSEWMLFFSVAIWGILTSIQSFQK